jgi:type 1 glutamine amidotransferase/nicotinamidase-related amidase
MVLIAAACRRANAEAPLLKLDLRSRTARSDGRYSVITRRVTWDPKATAIIVCDMWDAHHCLNAVRREKQMAPRMNLVLEKARSQGVFIIHAASDCMAAYKDHPARQRARTAPRAANLPRAIGQWCNKIPVEDKFTYPVDQSDGGEDDDLTEHARWHQELAKMGRNPRAPWKSQIDVLRIHDEDAISDSGAEIWNLLELCSIRNVILVGVHTNMCVLGRPFGLRQMAKNGKNVVLMRDMTDTMYNPARWPYVPHFRGTELVVEYIEKAVCPTITSDQIIGGSPFRFKGDLPRRAVVAIAESEYATDVTLPPLATSILADELGMKTTVLRGSPARHMIPGLSQALRDADILILSLRRVALPEKDLQAIKMYLASGKPLVAIRTSSHAFDARGKFPSGHGEWPAFDNEVLGGNYHNHYPAGPTTSVHVVPGAEKHPVLAGVATSFTSSGSLYKTSPLARSTTLLLTGSTGRQAPEPVAWTHLYKKGRIFYTSLGHRDDFRNPAFVQLMSNAMRWVLDVPTGPRR